MTPRYGNLVRMSSERGVATLTLTNPAAANGYSHAMMRQLDDAIIARASTTRCTSS
jgi:enoyl-CoA hydratase/carnithine racemase